MSEQPYIVSARKYRPGSFSTLVGQPALTHTLKNAIGSGRLAQAYLFCGPRGVGKTSSARIFAKTINCLHPTPEGEACGECESCKAIQQGNSFNLVELDAASNNSVDNIRTLCEQVNIPPSTGKYKVFIIDEVHMLSSSAFNAFLKTLEEPPSYAIFIMATTEKHKVLPTIISRCQVFDFKRITIPDMVNHLQFVASREGIVAEERALNVIARKADGAMRDALSIFDQVAACTGGNITYEATIDNLNVLDETYFFRLTEAFAEHDVPKALSLYSEIRGKGFDSQFFLNGLAAHLRDLMMMLDPRTANLLEVSQEDLGRYGDDFKKFPVKWYYEAIRILSEADLNYRQASNKQLLVELALIRLTVPFDSGAEGSTPLPSFQKISQLSSRRGKVDSGNTSVVKDKISGKSEEASEPIVPESTSTSSPESPRSILQAPGESRESKLEQNLSKGNRNQCITQTATFRLNEEDESNESGPELHEPVTTERLLEGMTAYTLSDPEAKTLETIIQTVSYRETGEDIFTIDIPHQGIQRSFESHMTRLIQFLRRHLRNGRLELRLNIPEKSGPRRDRDEVLREILKSNPTLEKFLNKEDFIIS